MIVYCVWAGDQYYPTGPRDLKGIFENKGEAEELMKRLNEEYAYGFRKQWDWVEITEETVILKRNIIEDDYDYGDEDE